MGRTIVVAFGGNAITKPGQRGDLTDQYSATHEVARELAKVIAAGNRLVVTHGNGPQVGNILRRVELAASELYVLPLDTCVSDSQGGMGYMIQQVLGNELRRAGIRKPVATIITQCVVAADDPAMKNPTKPIGSFMTAELAAEHARNEGWTVKEDAGRGWRRVVPSPKPFEIVEASVIRRLVLAGEIVIACGGGGIPVVRESNGDLRGIEAVIDKDLASALLAREIGADLLWVMTGVPRVALNFGKPNQTLLERMTVAEAKRYLAEGHFPAGSMGPKVAAAIDYLEKGGTEVLISDTEGIQDAFEGRTGTRVVAS